jgi:N-acetyl sugar amidotransferase
MTASDYQICRNCAMDTSDPTIRFDETGLCIYCRNYNELILEDWNKKRAIGPGPLAEKIRRRGRGKQFDCIIGISGGLDSSFLTHVAVKEMGLRPLLFHVDAGWNSNQAVSNIEKLIDGLGLELYTEVVDWEEMKEFQRAMFLSQIPDQDIPQDAVFFSAMYKFARQNGIKYVLTGSNYSLECVREPEAWGGYLGIDMRLISGIIRRFGRRKKLNLPLLDILMYRFYYRWVLGMRVGDPLNMVSYVKKDAERLLGELYGWEAFQHKHHESRFTRFFEDFWLPRKFGFEKRRAHFSSMILTGQMTRDAAIERLSRPELSEEVLMREFAYVAEKLDFTVEEFWDVFRAPNKTYAEYPNRRDLIDLGRRIYRVAGLDKRTVR